MARRPRPKFDFVPPLSMYTFTFSGGTKMDVPVNYLAVVVAALANYIIGSLWYGVLFRKAWLKLAGLSEMKVSVLSVVAGLIGALLTSYVLQHSLVFGNTYLKTSGVSGGLMGAFYLWLGFVAPVTVGVVIYEKKPWMYWIVNNAYWLISLLVMGTILSVWV
jgi:hypothetical protein